MFVFQVFIRTYLFKNFSITNMVSKVALTERVATFRLENFHFREQIVAASAFSFNSMSFDEVFSNFTLKTKFCDNVDKLYVMGYFCIDLRLLEMRGQFHNCDKHSQPAHG